MAYHGAVDLAGRFNLQQACPPGFAELASALNELVPEGSRTVGPLTEPDERRLVQLCYVLALYEQCYRALPKPDWPIISLGPEATLDDLTALCEERVVTDLVSLAAMFFKSASELVQGEVIELNPTFSGSSGLGGADADFIIDGCLVELKTTKKPKPGRQEFWQLVGYVLADWDDQYQIDSVGYYYSRQGVTLRWPLDGFLRSLAGKAVDLAKTRREFQDLMAGRELN